MNNTKLYVMVKHDELVGYDASHKEVLSLYIDPADKFVLNETLKFAITALGIKPQDCIFVTSDLVKTYFAKVIGMGVISPTDWLTTLTPSDTAIAA